MKKFLITILISFSILNAQSDPNIKWLHPTTQSFAFKWVKMWDANNWYLCGEYGSFMKTTDAGQTWTTKNNAGWPNITYPEIHTYWHANEAWFFDQNNGIVVGGNTSGILKTTDGGETFDTLRIIDGTNSGKNIYSIYFVNSNLGFISGNTAYKIHQTTDGGNTWTQVPNLPDGTYNDVYATDALNILTCTTSGIIYKTTDGGSNWNPIQVPTLQTLYDLEFTSTTTGYVCGDGGFFKMTTDGGATWTGGTNTPLGATNYKIKAINNEIYVAGNATNLFKSTDNGASWITLNMNTPGDMTGPTYCMDAISSSIVVAGIRGYIYKSVNSGNNWDNLLDRETDGSFYRSFYVENSTGKIIVAGRWADVVGTIIISDDGGENWYASPQTIPFDNRLLKMQMVNGNVGYFGGEYGYFAKTTDGAMSLTKSSLPIWGQNFIYNMDFIDELTGWVVGGLPQPLFTPFVVKTTDGGVTWIDQTPAGIPGPEVTVDFIDQNIGYMSGQNMYKTTNGGTNWVQVTLPGLSGSINSLKAFDANNIYISTSAAEFYKTTNGGTSWQSVTVPWGANLNFGQAWYDMNNGIQFGVLGAIGKTTDAGQTWETMNTGGWTVAGGKMIHPDTFYVGSSDKGQIFRYAKPSTQSTFQLSVDVSNGWNLVSVPGINPAGMLVEDWWNNLVGTVYKFNPGSGYAGVVSATPGEGYWLKNSVGETYNYPAIQIVTHNAITATAGWNMFGGFEDIVDVNALTTSTGNVLYPIYQFNPGAGYAAATNLTPGKGYWVKVSANCTITIPEALSKGSGEVLQYFKEEWGRIVVTDANGSSYTLYSVNGDSPNGEANVDLSKYELPPLPPAGNFDVRFSSGRIAEDLNTLQTIEMNSVTYPVKVTVQNMNLRIQDETRKELCNILQPGEEFIIGDNTINKFIVLSGELIAPIEYTLEQNYPNPFNPATTIKFSLADASDVSLTIYNTLGQKVKELVNEKLEAGRYSYQWDASDVATGMYIYELRTANFVSVKKMILLK